MTALDTLRQKLAAVQAARESAYTVNREGLEVWADIDGSDELLADVEVRLTRRLAFEELQAAIEGFEGDSLNLRETSVVRGDIDGLIFDGLSLRTEGLRI